MFCGEDARGGIVLGTASDVFEDGKLPLGKIATLGAAPLAVGKVDVGDASDMEGF